MTSGEGAIILRSTLPAWPKLGRSCREAAWIVVGSVSSHANMASFKLLARLCSRIRGILFPFNGWFEGEYRAEYPSFHATVAKPNSARNEVNDGTEYPKLCSLALSSLWTVSIILWKQSAILTPWCTYFTLFPQRDVPKYSERHARNAGAYSKGLISSVRGTTGMMKLRWA